MSVVVDTSVWSLALRRKREHLSAVESRTVAAWAELIRQRQVMLLGPIRQELLTGIRDERAFARLRSALRAFPDAPLAAEDYEHAAWCGNLCRRKGVAGSAVDFLLCSVALRREAAIFTTDGDFHLYADHLPIRLHRPSA
ncbi:MAG TPA: PIN domain-containing protein [Planctomycetota bacterium]|nr:PIN domain-containing protein [Planctomycetota bacterium]